MASKFKNSLLLLGQCMPSLKQNASKIRVRRLKMDENLNMYFKEDSIFWVHDPEKVCKSGDIVLIKEMPQKLTRLITHAIEEIVYPLGDITDPVTNKKIVVGRYRDHVEEDAEHFGKTKGAFDYKTAPPRGTQEGKKDFSHGPTYVKWYEDKKYQPFAK